MQVKDLISKATRSQDGQSLVEFALIVPILLLLIMGTLDLGRLYYIKIALQSAAREGVYYLSYNPGDQSNCDGSVCFQDTIVAVLAEANNLGVSVDPSEIVVSGGFTHGETAQVSVNQEINLFIFNFITGPVFLEGKARMLVQ
jgi:hypothetical protein